MKKVLTLLFLTVALAVSAQSNKARCTEQTEFGQCTNYATDNSNICVIHGGNGAGTWTQCSAITKAGSQCKKKAVNNSKYCTVHQGYDENSNATKAKPSSTGGGGRCKATTKAGKQCSRAARSGGYCWQHGG